MPRMSHLLELIGVTSHLPEEKSGVQHTKTTDLKTGFTLLWIPTGQSLGHLDSDKRSTAGPITWQPAILHVIIPGIMLDKLK